MKGENICHSRLLIMGVTRCLRTHMERANLEPYRRGLLGESKMIGKSRDLKPACVWSSDAGHGSHRKPRNSNKWSCQRPQLRLVMGWQRCQLTTSLWMWLLHRLRYNNGTANKYPWSKSFWNCVSNFGPTNWNTSSSSPLYTQLLELSIFLICAWELWVLVFQIIAFRVTVIMQASPLVSLVSPWWNR